MIVSQQKPIEEILKMLEDEKTVFIAGCDGCAEVCKTGGEKACVDLKQKLEAAAIKVAGYCVVDFMCNKLLVLLKISRYQKILEQCDSIIALSCGIGVQTIAAVSEKYVHPANNTMYLGGFQGTWPSSERCAECGECILDITAGICPITNCSKSLLNGPCGGAKNGKCEVDKEIDCGWEKIYRRLEKLGKLKVRSGEIKLRDYARMLTKSELRNSTFYDIEK